MSLRGGRLPGDVVPPLPRRQGRPLRCTARVRELEDFFTRLNGHLAGATDLEDFLVRTVVAATDEMRHDEHLALMLASEPGDTLSQLTVEGLPRIIRMASLFLAPQVEPYLDRQRAARLVDLLARLVISYFLAPSDHVDLGDPDSARTFVSSHILPAFEPITAQEPSHDRTPERQRDDMIGRARSTTSTRSSRSRRRIPTRSSTSSRNNADTHLHVGLLPAPGRRCASCTRRPRPVSGTRTTDLPWDTDVDVEQVVAADQEILGTGIDPSMYDGTPVEKWGDKEWLEFGIEGRNWSSASSSTESRAR